MAKSPARTEVRPAATTPPLIDVGHDVFEAMKNSAEQAANLLRAIGSTHRLMILCYLMDGPKTVTEICQAIGARQSLVSQHLIRLREDRLVTAERRSHFVVYSILDTPAHQIVATLHAHFCPKNRTATAKN